MMNYFEKRNLNKEKAHEWVDFIQKNHKKEIEELSNATKLYPDEPHHEFSKAPMNTDMKILVEQSTTVDTILNYYKEDSYVCALNFASYKHPGGMFYDGSMAQEESLCHASFLYPVLESPTVVNSFYRKHLGRLNRALYHSDLLFSPNIPFYLCNLKAATADIITCAAPNKKAAQKYQHVSNEEIHIVLNKRIDAVLYAASMENTKEHPIRVLVLGAFGCGVFGNDVTEVISIFKDLLTNKYKNQFEKVIFAIPDSETYNIAKSIILS